MCSQKITASHYPTDCYAAMHISDPTSASITLQDAQTFQQLVPLGFF